MGLDVAGLVGVEDTLPSSWLSLTVCSMGDGGRGVLKVCLWGPGREEVGTLEETEAVFASEEENA